MPEISFEVNTSEGRRRMSALVGALSDLDPVLRRFGKYLRWKSKRAFSEEGPGWQGLAQSTKERLEHTYTGRIAQDGRLKATPQVRKLRESLMRDVFRGKEGAQPVARELLGALEHGGQGSRLARAIKAHMAPESKRGKALARIAAELEKADAKPNKIRRGKTQASKHTLLGKLASSLKATVKSNELRVFSSIEWAGVHNQGGTAGHGARIPARRFLELTTEDIEVLTGFIADAGLAAFEGEK